MLVFVIFGVALPESFGAAMSSAFDYMIASWGWSFILGASIFLFLIVFLLLSPVGEIKLGADDEKPAYSNEVWFAMLFSCGMGIGLLFWGVSEPIWHYMWPPFGEPYTAEAVHVAMRYAFFHWGFHPWAIYAVVAGSLAYFSYRKGLPMLLSSCLEPILGRKGIEGPWGILVNILGVFATLFGLATSLGLGAMQIGAGLESLFGIPSTGGVWVAIVVVVTAAAVISTATGIDRGIKWLSQINIVVAGLLMLLVFIIGPTLFILNIFTHATGDYLQNIIYMSFGLDAAGSGTEGWYGAWTIFYWAWWISWSPFVGLFVASISRGRTIREFVFGALLVPTLLTFLWFAVFGGTALNIELNGTGGLAAVAMDDVSSTLFVLLDRLPGTFLLTILALLVLSIFFITSADSATYVLAMMTSGGELRPRASRKIIWGILQSGAAVVLLLAGGLEALQRMAIIAALPFTVVMLFMMRGLLKAMKYERDREIPVVGKV